MTDLSTHPDPAVRIGPLAEKLKAAQERHEQLAKVAREASRDETSALNRLNEAQKAFDEAVAALRKGAPRDSNWNRFGQIERRMPPDPGTGVL